MNFLSLFIATFILTASFQAKADFPEFEPSMLCLASAAGGYMMADSGNEMIFAAGGCAIGYFAGSLINDHYRTKFTAAKQKELDGAQQIIDNIARAQAEANTKEEAEKLGWYRKRIKTVPGGKMPNGAIRKSTLEVELQSPAQTDDVNVRFGR